MPSSPHVLVAVTSDLFLQSRITTLALSLGVTAHFVSNSDELMERLTADTSLVVIDLSAADHDPFAIARTLKGRRPSLRILGFFPHVKTDLKTRGEKAGVDFVVPNSKFMETLRKILGEEVDRLG